MQHCIDNELYNAAVLLFRPLLLHIFEDITKGEYYDHKGNRVMTKDLSFQKVINLFRRDGTIFKNKEDLANAQLIKGISNDINHNFESATKEEAYIAFKIIVNIINHNYSY